jgi:hypothetical protein
VINGNYGEFMVNSRKLTISKQEKWLVDVYLMEMTHEYNRFYGGSLGFNQQQMVNSTVWFMTNISTIIYNGNMNDIW